MQVFGTRRNTSYPQLTEMTMLVQ